MRVRERERETRCLPSTLPSFPSLITTAAPKSIVVVVVAAFAMEHKDDPAAAAAATAPPKTALRGYFKGLYTTRQALARRLRITHRRRPLDPTTGHDVRHLSSAARRTWARAVGRTHFERVALAWSLPPEVTETCLAEYAIEWHMVVAASGAPCLFTYLYDEWQSVLWAAEQQRTKDTGRLDATKLCKAFLDDIQGALERPRGSIGTFSDVNPPRCFMRGAATAVFRYLVLRVREEAAASRQRRRNARNADPKSTGCVDGETKQTVLV